MPRSSLDPLALIPPARAGDARARARLFSLVENGGPAARTVLEHLAAHAGRARIIGITGPPGAGKSTLLSGLARSFRADGQTVAVLAVDPSSPFSGGALLGDRLRMAALHGDPGACIRSVATRGAVGGLARRVDDLVAVADGLGFDVVLVETVGAGQDEVAIARVAPTVVLVETPELGDEVQAIKAGLLEIADILVVNKADRGGADEAAAILRAMLAPRASGWRVPVVRTVAATGQGVPELYAAIAAHRAHLEESGRLAAWHAERTRARLLEAVRERVIARAMAALSEEQIACLVGEILAGRLTLDAAADRLIGGTAS